MDGIKNRIMPPKAGKYFQGDSLPETLKDAIDEFENSTWIQGVLGERFCRSYLESKKKEWQRYTRQVTDWELETYLNRL